jgi:TatD DNase family protein
MHQKLLVFLSHILLHHFHNVHLPHQLHLPLEQLLTETDAPFLSPYPGKVNVPQNVSIVIEHIAKLRNMDVKEVDQIIMENCEAFFDVKFA